MKVGDLVKLKHDDKPYGFVIKIDKDFYGARQAFKRYNWERGKCINSMEADGIGPTKDGIRDRVLVEWVTHGCEYVDSSSLEVVSDS
jgi:hypothetical protein